MGEALLGLRAPKALRRRLRAQPGVRPLLARRRQERFREYSWPQKKKVNFQREIWFTLRLGHRRITRSFRSLKISPTS